MQLTWNSHAPMQWKWGSLKNLIKKSISICSNEKLLEDKLNCLRNVIIKVNNYLPKLSSSIIKIELEKTSSDQHEVPTNATSKQMQLVLP